MSRPIKREYVPLVLRQAMKAVRLANARSAANGTSTFHYIIMDNVHEAVDAENIRILDSKENSVISYVELLSRLPEDLRKQVLYS